MYYGIGYDIHRFKKGNSVVIGGVKIRHTRGLEGHSDADAAAHALMDALLGAAGLPDIGRQFPDSSEEFKGIDSRVLLSRTIDILRERSFSIGNIDCTIVLQQPKIAAFIPEMIKILSGALRAEPSRINVKAKTSEKLGFIGREEGISAYAVTLLEGP